MAPGPRTHLMRTWLTASADDLCYVAGVCLVGVGVYRQWPEAIWFYAGAVCLVVGLVLTCALAGRRA